MRKQFLFSALCLIGAKATIVGGAFNPRWQGGLIDGDGMQIGGMALESVRVSFFLPVLCFIVVAI